MKLTTSILIIGSVFILSGCSLPSINRSYTIFPTPPKEVKITRPPIVQFNSESKTYIVTSEFVQRSVEKELYLRRVLEWRNVNQVD